MWAANRLESGIPATSIAAVETARLHVLSEAQMPLRVLMPVLVQWCRLWARLTVERALV